MNLTLKSASPMMWLLVGLLAGQQSVQSQPAHDDQSAAPQPGKAVTMQLHRAVTVRGLFVGPFGEEKRGEGGRGIITFSEHAATSTRKRSLRTLRAGWGNLVSAGVVRGSFRQRRLEASPARPPTAFPSSLSLTRLSLFLSRSPLQQQASNAATEFGAWGGSQTRWTRDPTKRWCVDESQHCRRWRCQTLSAIAMCPASCGRCNVHSGDLDNSSFWNQG